MKNKVIFSLLLFSIILLMGFSDSDQQSISPQSQECIDCHSMISPGIVADWRMSLHSKVSPSAAKTKAELERRVSSESIPGELSGFIVGCYECHGLNSDDHKDNFEHFGYNINVVVSPNDCAVCHATEVTQYQDSKKGYALDILRKNPVFDMMVGTYTDERTLDDKMNFRSHIISNSRNESCYACHGTEVGVNGLKTIETDLGEIEVPELTNWPNVGVGRINPDGSRGACTSCHPRHSFAIDIARKPSTCGQCHLEPDVPAFNVYKSSKHGTIYEGFEKKFDFTSVPWVIGKDFTAPTCATCHNSLITDSDGNVIAERSHDFGDRLWVRIFGLPYAHNQPKTPKTFDIRNADGLALPTTFENNHAKDFLIDENEVSARKDIMRKVCTSCHGSTWVNSHFINLDSTVITTNNMTKTAKDLVLKAWDMKMADNSNPFDEPIEQEWVLSWLFYSNSVRYARAMMGPDYAGFKNGWFDLSNTLQKMRSSVKNFESSKGKE